QGFFDSVLAGASDTVVSTSCRFRLLSGDGRTYWLESKSRAVDFDGDGNPLRIIGHVTDITERKPAEEQLNKLNRALLAINNCNQALLRANNQKELLEDICRIVVEVGGYRMAWVGYAEDDPGKSVKPVAVAGVENGFLETANMSWGDVDRGRGATGIAIRTGRHCAIRNIRTDPRCEPWREEAVKRSYASALCLPLKNEHRVFGSLTIYSSIPDAFDSEETELLSSLSDNMAYGITMLQNRTAQELTLIELRQSEERYRSLFENRHTVMLIVEPESGSIVDANPAAVGFYGWNRDRIMSMNINEINTLTDREIKDEMRRAHQLHCNCFYFRHRIADGSIRDVEVVSGPIFIQGKSLLYSIVNDVTEKKRAQEQLVENNRRMHYILSEANAGLWEMGMESGETVWSEEVWRLFGIRAHSCEPSYENWLKTIVPEERDLIRRTAEDALEKGAEFNATWRTRDADGSMRWLMSRGTPFKDSDGQVLRYVGIIIDITDRKIEEEEKLRLETQLRKAQRLETIGTLAGGIAHDFNNILTPILGYAEIGLLSPAGKTGNQNYFNEIMLAADRAKNLISQILAFSKAQETTFTVINVQSVIDEALRLLRPSIPSTVTIKQEIDRTCGNILADPSQIHQIIVNLCTNAFQALDRETGSISIKLEEVAADTKLLQSISGPHAERYVRLTISDTGCGIDDPVMERIFEPFFTTKSINQGTGLGLSVVHGIIAAHNGTITVSSHPGHGATFSVYLPVIDKKADHTETEPRPVQGNASILFVDDEQASTRMMSVMLTRLGFRIETRNSPVEALELFRQKPLNFDLVITDLTMPEMNGLDLAAQLHRIRTDLPIILMTGYGKDLDNNKVINSHGIRQFLKKPVKMSLLSSTINEVISNTLPQT
ncbi:MAG: PAS domain S-box protein, partial [Chlorobiaceae bacterium]|nr:PAS domain S-box protein [Chlorobiaceae bacterium]